MGIYSDFFIRFESSIPSVAAIKVQFKKQTGLDLELRASIKLPTFDTMREVEESLLRDLPLVTTLKNAMEEELKPLMAKGDYEQAMKRRDEFLFELDSYTALESIHFHLDDFYPIPCSLVEDRTFIFTERSVRHYYFYESLQKVLVDLGGVFLDAKVNPIGYPSKWRTLKHWWDYPWYNKPSK